MTIDTIKQIMDGTAIGSVILALAQVVPHLTALAGLIWFIYRIRESRLNAKLIQAQIDALPKNP